MRSLIKDLKSYTASLKALNLKDQQLLATSIQYKTLFRLPTLLYRLLKLAVLAVLTLPGLLLFAPIFVLTAYLSRRKTAEALAASSVKVRGHDVMATWKILIALALAPVFYTFYTIASLLLNNYNHVWGYIPAGTPSSLIISTCVLVLPMITYAALLFGEQGMDLLKSIYPLVLTLSPSSSHIIDRMMEQRRLLVTRVREMIDQFGSDIFPDCDEVSKWRERGPRKLYADISPLAEQEDLWGINELV
jgi:glycerol-3-phosphate O-acyltransferase/dihydroxyacetone phosphate acyltransferase